MKYLPLAALLALSACSDFVQIAPIYPPLVEHAPITINQADLPHTPAYWRYEMTLCFGGPIEIKVPDACYEPTRWMD